MRTAIFAVVAAGAVNAAPTLPKRQAYSQADVNVLNYALTLEHLEDKFYREALANYTAADFAALGSFFEQPFYDNLGAVASEENTHVGFLTAALQAAGAPAVQECTYSFPATTPAEFLALASVIEGVGVAAYLGGAMEITSPEYLTAAAQIAPVEARHTAYFRKQLGMAGAPAPFDTPLDMDQVYTLASPFIVSCPPSNPPLPVKAFPAVTLATTGPIKAGQTVTLTTTAMGATYAAFMSLTGPVFQPAMATSGGYTTTIPEGVTGQSYAVLTANNMAVSDDTTIAGPAIIEVSEVM